MSKMSKNLKKPQKISKKSQSSFKREKKLQKC